MTPTAHAAGAGSKYRIVTAAAGVYRVDYAALSAAGFDATGIDTSTFQLFNFDQEVPLWLFDGGDNRFDPGDYFLFYAQAYSSRFSRTNIYWFTAGQNSRLVGGERSATPASAPLITDFWETLHFEEDLTYKSDVPLTGDEADRWYWRYAQACSPTTRTCSDKVSRYDARTFTVDLPNVSATAHTAIARVVIQGASNDIPNPDHHMVALVNSTQVGDSTFEGFSEFTGVYNVASSLLISGANQLRLNFPYDQGIESKAYINRLQFTYMRSLIAQNNALIFRSSTPGALRFQVSGFTSPTLFALDITDPKAPVHLTDGAIGGADPYSLTFETGSTVSALGANAVNATGEYIAASANGWLTPTSITLDAGSNLKSPANGADYIIISHATFMAQAQQLADYRATANGYRTMTIDVQNIYDEFNGGIMDQQAIRDFVSYASHYWQPPRPAFFILIGDGHYDLLNNLGSTDQIFIPPFLAAVDPFQGETSADNRYVDVLGDDQYDSDADATHTIRRIEIEGGKMALSADFGYVSPINAQAVGPKALAPQLVKAIGDMVFFDEDLDGIWDANERGVEDVTVNLLQADSVVSTTLTDPDGRYFFEDLSTGTYTLEFLPEANWQLASANNGTDDRYDSDPDPATGRTPSINYTYPQNALADWDAGVFHHGTIGNRVWNDDNANGLQDDGEAGIAGVLMQLIQNGSVIATTTTNAKGYYYFFDLPDGLYDVAIAGSNFTGVLAGWTLSPRDVGADGMPDASLGRFPVNTVAEAQEMVSRIIAYEASPPADWQRRVVFVSDNPDAAGDFYGHSDEVADNIWPYTTDSVKIYYQTSTATDTSPEMNTAILNNINGGALFVTYNGHSSKRTWGDNFFDQVDIDKLNNSVFPIFLPMTCLEGQYINPGTISMGEKAVRTIGKGAVASWSPTGLGVATGHQFIYNHFFEVVVAGQRIIGPITVEAKRALFESHSLFKDLLETYVLFGDPALRIQAPTANLRVVKTVSPINPVPPGNTLTYTLTYDNHGNDTALNAVLSDILPAGLINPQIVSANPPVSLVPNTQFTWALGDLAAGQSGVITISATVDPALSSPYTIVNTAVISSDSPDADESDNTSSVTSAYGAPVTLGGVAWYDTDGDAARDPLETTFLPGVPITVTRLSDNSVVYTTVTGGDGSWLAANLPADGYRVAAGPSAGVVMTTPSSVDVVLVGGASRTDIDFGYISPTAITIVEFTAEMGADAATIHWRTSEESDVAGFRVYRSSGATDHGKRVSDLVAATGGGVGAPYEFTDASVRSGNWYYWLEVVNQDGSSEWFGPVLAVPPAPSGSHRVYLSFIRAS